ncbi:hypothetical protein NE237_014400 [Protea cynaroides]|uniref:Uncharacterized protein n=1 Tax=Protea cynaroides TaxID=273540 RepID=A0A9Q0KC30_9MAGN|nr:hypothetical protein NE237_014400 [Protea cynaroides]
MVQVILWQLGLAVEKKRRWIGLNLELIKLFEDSDSLVTRKASMDGAKSKTILRNSPKTVSFNALILDNPYHRYSYASICNPAAISVASPTPIQLSNRSADLDEEKETNTQDQLTAGVSEDTAPILVELVMPISEEVNTTVILQDTDRAGMCSKNVSFSFVVTAEPSTNVMETLITVQLTKSGSLQEAHVEPSAKKQLLNLILAMTFLMILILVVLQGTWQKYREQKKNCYLGLMTHLSLNQERERSVGGLVKGIQMRNAIMHGSS